MTISVERALVKRLTDSTAVSALLGDRIMPHGASEQTTFPYALYTTISDDKQVRMSGASELSFYRIQIDICATNYASLLNVRDAILNRLHGFRGTVTLNADTRYFHAIFVESERGQTVPPTDGSDKIIYKRIMDIFLSTQESLTALNA